MRSSGVAALLTATFALVGAGVLFVWNQRQNDTDRVRLNAARQTMLQAERVVAAGIRWQSAERGYLVSGGPQDLAQLNAIQSAVGPFPELRRLTAADPKQAERVQALATLTAAQIEDTGRRIDLRRDRGFEAAQKALAEDRTKTEQASTRALAWERAIADEESRRIAEIAAAGDRRVQLTNGVLLGSAALMALVFSLSGWRKRGTGGARRDEQAGANRLVGGLARLNAGLEQRLATQTQELERVRQRLSEQLEQMRQREREATGLLAQGEAARAELRRVAEAEVRAGVQLRESETLFRRLAENIREVCWTGDAGGSEFFYIGPAYAKIWGRSCESLLANPRIWLEAVYPEDRARMERAVGTKRAAGEYDEMFRIVRPDGAIVWLHERVFRVNDANSAAHRLVGLAEDITARRELEEKFWQAQKMESLGMLASGIAHDFNNVLSAIIGYAGLAQLKLHDGPAVGGYLAAMLKAGGRAAELVRQITSFGRKGEEERRVVQLGPLVRESLELLRATLPATIEFEVTCSPETPAVLADPTQIQQIMMNLGTNAWQAMEDGVGRLQVGVEPWVADDEQVRAEPQLRPGRYARISATDLGCGMDPATVRRMFEPFFTTKPAAVGTGLGLAVVHGIMTRHRGLITVHSLPILGTTFRLYFPAQDGELTVVKAESTAVLQGRGERVLLIDDEVALTRLGEESLRALGYEVEVANRAEPALARVRSGAVTFALVIVDLTMPGMTGLAVAQELRRIRPELPVLLVTGKESALRSEAWREAGIRQVLLKPVAMAELAVAVQTEIFASKTESPRG